MLTGPTGKDKNLACHREQPTIYKFTAKNFDTDFRMNTILQNKRMWLGRVSSTPPPPPNNFRKKVPQQIIYHRKGNLSESLNRLTYQKKILIPRFYSLFTDKGGELLLTQVASLRYSIQNDGGFVPLLFEPCEYPRILVSDVTEKATCS